MTPGVTVVRNLTVFGYHDREGHGEVHFEDVRVPASNLIAGEGEGFMIAQARLGPGRIHHCMRAIGAAEVALELLCRRAAERVTFGRELARRANIQDWIAESRIEIEMARLHSISSARSATPIVRMQWWMRPGPSRAWAIMKPSPSPATRFAAGTRASVKVSSPWPSRSV